MGIREKNTPRTIVLAAPEQIMDHCKALLETEPSFWVITETQDKEATIEAVKRSQANILLLDVGMAQQTQFDLVSHALKVSPATRILLLGADDSSPEILDALASGARGVVRYADLENWLVKALLKVDIGEAWVSRKMAFHIVNRIRHLSICDHFLQRAGS